MRTIFAMSVDVELQLWKEEIVEPFACDKFVGTNTVDHITHCASTLVYFTCRSVLAHLQLVRSSDCHDDIKLKATEP